jgi:hypothetical protein
MSVARPSTIRRSRGREGQLVPAVDALHGTRQSKAAPGRQVQGRPAPRADALNPRERTGLSETQHRQDHAADDETWHEHEVRHRKEDRREDEEPGDAAARPAREPRLRCRTVATAATGVAPNTASVTGTSIASPRRDVSRSPAATLSGRSMSGTGLSLSLHPRRGTRTVPRDLSHPGDEPTSSRGPTAIRIA